MATGKYGCRKVRVYPADCSHQLGRNPSRRGRPPKCLLLKSFSGEGTLWDLSLLVTIALARWDTPAPCTPPLPLCLLDRRDLGKSARCHRLQICRKALLQAIQYGELTSNFLGGRTVTFFACSPEGFMIFVFEFACAFGLE